MINTAHSSTLAKTASCLDYITISCKLMWFLCNIEVHIYKLVRSISEQQQGQLVGDSEVDNNLAVSEKTK